MVDLVDLKIKSEDGLVIGSKIEINGHEFPIVSANIIGKVGDSWKLEGNFLVKTLDIETPIDAILNPKIFSIEMKRHIYESLKSELNE